MAHRLHHAIHFGKVCCPYLPIPLNFESLTWDWIANLKFGYVFCVFAMLILFALAK